MNAEKQPMFTEQQIEKQCMDDYHEHEGKTILAQTVYGMTDHYNRTFNFSPEDAVYLLISKDKKEEEVICWNQDGWCDPIWTVESKFKHSDLEEESILWVAGISRCTNGKIEHQSDWKIVLDCPVLPTAHLIDSKKTKQSQPTTTVVCPHCNADIELQVQKESLMNINQTIEDSVAKGIDWKEKDIDNNSYNTKCYIGTVSKSRFLVASFDIEDQGFPPGSRGYDGSHTKRNTITRLTREQAERLCKDAESNLE
jgi:hypothetical protein